MRHLTSNEIIDFVSMTDMGAASLKNAALVTGHISECENCLRKVRAFQVIYDEFATLGSHPDAKYELFRRVDDRMPVASQFSEIEDDK